MQSLSAQVTWHTDGGLQLIYRLAAQLDQLKIPERQSPGFADGLWQQTCFELFITTPDNATYQEFNFSPSGQWAVYRFRDYRQRLEWNSQQHYAIHIKQDNYQLELQVIIPAIDLPLILPGTTVHLGLTAVIEKSDGQLFYWALNHPKAVPDFHDRAGFIYTLNKE